MTQRRPMSEQAANRLASESSPYLLQHAHNPVDWYPWGEEAFAAAQQAKKPIFLSVGYSSCHWCHVMERESFEDAATAQLMNELFINIKVDREERPDVDEIYMHAVQLFSGGHGGWPMSVFLTPTQQPFYAGTYFPPQDRPGMPSFPRILRATASAWREKRDSVEDTGRQVVESLQQMAHIETDKELPGVDLLDSAYQLLQSQFDPEHGGFGSAPKFPHAMDVSLLLRYGQRTDINEPNRMALHTLHCMARGGLFDQLAGGFHRYSTDARWLIPHFEKMLYDNALLVRAYVDGWLVSRDDFHRQIAERTLAYVQREMTDAAGGFYSAQDADSEGVEGRYFVWTPQEIRAVLAEDLAQLAIIYYDIGDAGNFEHGASVLSVPRDDDLVAAELGLSWQDFQSRLLEVRERLLEHRHRRVAPETDDKIIVAWNSLMISAQARAFQVWRNAEWLRAAEKAAQFILQHSPEHLFRTYRRGTIVGHGFLDDYSAFVGACLDLYEATFAPHWLEQALRWNAIIDSDFSDLQNGGYFYSSRSHETLVAASRNFLDTATPSGNSLQLSNLLRLSHLTGEGRYGDRAQQTLRAHAHALRQYRTGMSEMLCALDFHLGPASEVVVAAQDETREQLLTEVFGVFHPNKVVAGWPLDQRPPAALGLLEGRQPPRVGGAVFVCRAQACQAPVSRPEEVRGALQAARNQKA